MSNELLLIFAVVAVIVVSALFFFSGADIGGIILGLFLLAVGV